MKTLRLPAALWGKPAETPGIAQEHRLLAVHSLFTVEARQVLERHLGLGCFAWQNRASGGRHAPCFVYLPLIANHGAVIARLVDDGVHEGRPHHLRIEATQLSSEEISHETIAALLHPAAWTKCRIDDRRVEAELHASVAPPPWQRTVLAALAAYTGQPLLVADHDAFSIKPNSGLRVIRVADTPHRNALHPMTRENEASGGTKTVQAPPTAENDTRKRGLSRGVVIAVTLLIILSGLLAYSEWRWWHITQEVAHLKTQVNKLEEALSSERADKERLQRDNEASMAREKAAQQDMSDLRAINKKWEQAAREFGAHNPEELDQRVKETREKEDRQLTRLRDAIANRDAWFRDGHRLWFQLRDELDKWFSGYGSSGPER